MIISQKNECGDTYNMKKIGTHIGNAVLVKLAEAIGISILKHLKQEDKLV